MTTIRIDQLTDIHIADWSGLRPSDALNKRLTGWANHRFRRSDKHQREPVEAAVATLLEDPPDAVVVTGDLTNTGSVAELNAANTVLAPLLEAGIRTAVLPGNHDVYVSDAFDGRLSTAWGRYAQDTPDVSPLEPRILRVRELSILLLNTAVVAPPFMAWGKVGEAQLNKADALVDAEHRRGQTLAVAMHHHLTPCPGRKTERFRALLDAPAVADRVLAWNPALVFHGHNHHHELRRLDHAAGPLVIGTGSTSLANDPRPHKRGEIARFTFDGGSLVELAFRRWNPRVRTWGPWDTTLPESVTRVVRAKE